MDFNTKCFECDTALEKKEKLHCPSCFSDWNYCGVIGHGVYEDPECPLCHPESSSTNRRRIVIAHLLKLFNSNADCKKESIQFVIHMVNQNNEIIEGQILSEKTNVKTNIFKQELIPRLVLDTVKPDKV